MSEFERLDEILDDEGYQIDYKNVHLTVDDLMVFKKLFARQDAAIAETLTPFYRKFENMNDEIGVLKKKVFDDHEARIARLENRMFWRKIGMIGAAIAAVVTIVILLI